MSFLLFGLGVCIGFLLAMPIVTAVTLNEVEKRRDRHLEWIRKNLREAICPTCGSHISIWGTEARCNNCGTKVEKVPS